MSTGMVFASKVAAIGGFSALTFFLLFWAVGMGRQECNLVIVLSVCVGALVAIGYVFGIA